MRARDIGAIFRFLASRGWSRSAIAAATGLTETRVRAVAKGTQLISSYDVLERIADGLKVDRGLMGLAFVDAPQPSPARVDADLTQLRLRQHSMEKATTAVRLRDPSTVGLDEATVDEIYADVRRISEDYPRHPPHQVYVQASTLAEKLFPPLQSDEAPAQRLHAAAGYL